MVDGFKLRISSHELAEHCTNRAKYHRRRASEKEAELPKLREAITAIKSHAPAVGISNMTKGSSYRSDDPVGDLEHDINEHKNKAIVFDFFASHLFEEDYTLDEGDLTRLEMLRR